MYYFGCLSSGDVVAWPEERTIPWWHAGLTNSPARITTYNPAHGDPFNKGVEGAANSHILESLAHGLFSIAERLRDHLSELPSCNITANPEIRANFGTTWLSCSATRIPSDDTPGSHMLDEFPEGRAWWHVLEGPCEDGLIEACCQRYYLCCLPARNAVSRLEARDVRWPIARRSCFIPPYYSHGVQLNYRDVKEITGAYIRESLTWAPGR